MATYRHVRSVVFPLPTAQLASRVRKNYGRSIDIDIVHAIEQISVRCRGRDVSVGWSAVPPLVPAVAGCELCAH